MKHQIKTAIFKTLGLIPDHLGDSLYHFLQGFSENRNIGSRLISTEKTFETLMQICAELQIELKGKSIIELGSGWLPIIPYLFLYEAKVASVATYDLNQHYQFKAISALNTLFSTRHQVEIHPTNGKYALPKNVHYHPKQDIVEAALPESDLVFSRFVLEHIPPEVLLAMHQKFKAELAPGSHIIHFISPSDHRAFSDKTLSLQDFLQYSPSEWDGIQTRFDYHNRLRLPQYLALFEKAGLEVVYLTSHSPEPGSASHKLFKQVKLHPDYFGYSDAQLTAGSINVVLKVSA